ncbi:SDR family oxidoreductase [Marinibacterium profundimaris]|uniref:Short-chain dehydrogenase n=1 Tax=Marinibacterium profundimaris TaxID=1679460 RepID=A0A225NDQ5_9RHOB|nr:SDR family oxidoreductase [Marinibacterium profundimaris]OWU70377.1 short-chain dehydrogenase [Marinibacterium profundimaris]
MKILITGGNRGIGAEMAARYRAEGHEVLATARDGSAELALDVSDPASVEAMAQAVEGPLDLLVCNAGVYLEKGQRLESGYEPELWAQSFAVNVTGVFLVIRALLPQLRQAEAGKIAIISSQMASQERAPGGSYIYRASKAAVLNLGRNLATDLKDEGLAVGIYHPGWVQTEMGGASAELTPEQAAEGLIQRFDALSVGTTGCFETWDGRPHAY